ncbi:hypothetical protein BBK82_35415 [Lentzea guizhouensis]|uniref:MFS transporter n=1 Tax=Lentzea guizhouensis TaxID=1586287 RepID=A0A1B2HZX7_9PSEU|nr:MFS transporter [Lentzea guizhouensis]ANZ43276.1 hypothetical protein BBK82_35415 [Lentzea guizhouensis]
MRTSARGNALRWAAAYASSVTGDSVFFLALSWTAARAGGPEAVGIVTAAGALPRAVLLLGGGVLADRLGAHRVAIGMDMSRGVLVLAAAAIMTITAPQLWLLVPLAFVFGVLDALYLPAVSALPALITTPDGLDRIQGLRGLALRAGNLAGPLVGGIALAHNGEAAAFGGAGALFLVSLALLLVVRTHPRVVTRPERSHWRDLRAGVRYLRGHRVLAPLTLVIGISELSFAGPLVIGVVLLVEQRGWGPTGMGWIVGGFAAGGGLAALALAAGLRPPRPGLVMPALLTAGGIAIIGMVCVADLVTVTALAAAVGAVVGVASTLAATLGQAHCDPAYLGRTASVLALATVGLTPLLYPLTGAAAAALGVTAVFVGCGTLVLTAAFTAFSSAALRGAELDHEESSR